jgi:tripartite-type tricarboxylate transporter receptor subunit TctC
VEFIATAGPGGGTDIFSRTVQSIITKHKLMSQPIVVNNKSGGSGAEGWLYVKNAAGDPHKVVFGTSNTWQQPMLSNVPYKHTDFTPVAAMVQDEFMLWVKQDSPIQNAGDFVKAVAAKNGDWNMGGALSKDTDEMLTHLIEKTANVKMTFVPFKSGGEAAVQLAGGHVASHTNNPSESVGQWKAGSQRPLCVFNTQRLPAGPKVTATQGWSDIPTCQEAGLAIPLYQQPRTVWLPAKVTPEQVAYYVDVMKKVQATPEWKEYLERTQQTSVFLTGDAFAKLMNEDMVRTQKIGVEQGWIASK